MKKKTVGIRARGAARWPQVPACARVRSCSYIAATDLVPPLWRRWFWGLISEDAPFSWGDNNLSLVRASRFADHCEDRLDDGPATTRFINKLRALGETYIDLEGKGAA